MVNPSTVPLHVELDTPTGLVYALIEDWRPDPDTASRKVLALQPANGSGEPTGQPCTPQRLKLADPQVDRLVKRYPELHDLVAEARAVQPEPQAPPSLSDLVAEVARLSALVQGNQRPAAAEGAPAV